MKSSELLSKLLSTREKQIERLEARVRLLEKGRYARERGFVEGATPPRRGEDWTEFEKEILQEKLHEFVGDISRKFGRTRTGIYYAVLRMIVSFGFRVDGQ